MLRVSVLGAAVEQQKHTQPRLGKTPAKHETVAFFYSYGDVVPEEAYL